MFTRRKSKTSNTIFQNPPVSKPRCVAIINGRFVPIPKPEPEPEIEVVDSSEVIPFPTPASTITTKEEEYSFEAMVQANEVEDGAKKKRKDTSRNSGKIIERELAIVDGELLQETERFFSNIHEVESIRILMMVPDSYLNDYINRDRSVTLRVSHDYRLMLEYHRKAKYFNNTWNVSLLVGILLGTVERNLKRLLEKFTPEELHLAAKKTLGLEVDSNLLSSEKYAEIRTISRAIKVNHVGPESQTAPPQVENEPAETETAPASTKVIEETEETVEAAVPEEEKKEEEKVEENQQKANNIAYDVALKYYISGEHDVLSDEAKQLFDYPDLLVYFRKFICAYWNNRFMNGYAKYINDPDNTRLDRILEHDMEQLSSLLEKAKKVAPYNLFVQDLREQLPEGVFDKILDDLHFTPEMTNEAVLFAINHINAKQLTVVTPDEVKKFENMLGSSSKAAVVTANDGTEQPDPNVEPETKIDVIEAGTTDTDPVSDTKPEITQDNPKPTKKKKKNASKKK